MIHGKDFILREPEGDRDIGFVTTRFVDAPSPEQAGERALALLGSDKDYTIILTWSREAGRKPQLHVKEVVEMDWFHRRFRQAKGFTFYSGDDSPT